MTKLTIRNCELFIRHGGSTDAVAFPVTVCSAAGEVLCDNVEMLADILWAEPNAARVFRDRRECEWYVANFCGEFGKGVTRQETQHDSCIAQMYGDVAL